MFNLFAIAVSVSPVSLSLSICFKHSIFFIFWLPAFNLWRSFFTLFIFILNFWAISLFDSGVYKLSFIASIFSLWGDIGKYLDITLGGNVNSTTMIIDKQTTDQICCLYTNNVFEPTAQVDEGYGLQLRTRYVDEIAPRGGSVYCKYITKPITLSGTSTMIRVMFAASVPNQAAVDVYYKSYINGGSDQYDDVIWTLMEQSNTINTGSTAETDQFVDYEYTAENVPAFDVVAVKIVFRGTSSSQIPKIKDFRVISTI